MGMKERQRQKKIREYVINRDGLICCYCEKLLLLNNVTMEHIVPDSKRGTFNTTNLTVSCYNCNNNRGNKPFFEYIKNFNFNENKLLKYKKMYFNNLRIKVLNIAKEEHLFEDHAVPQELIKKACQVLKIKNMNFSSYEDTNQFEIKFNNICDRKKIKFCFEQLIKIIESDSK